MPLNASKPLVRCLLLAVLALGLVTPSSTGQSRVQREPTFRQRLNAGLQARRPSEIAFVEAVADTVGRGELSENLVNRVFFWARTRPAKGRTRHRPIIYFQPALERIAQQGRLTIRSNLEAIAAAGR